MRLLLTGAKGQLGHSLTQYTPAGWETLFADKVQLDITQANNVKKVIKEFKPNIIINTAAYTAVDKAEVEKEIAYAVNVTGARIIAQAARSCGADFFHISTDYVFDGNSKKPYVESDKCEPINVYGDSKRQGEIAILSEYPNAKILRTSWVYSEHGRNFVKTIAGLISQGNEVRVVSDQVGCPTYANDIAETLYKLAMIENLPGGVYHYSGDTQLSWYDFSRLIASVINKDNANIVKVSSSEFASPARRPHSSIMDCSKIKNLGIDLSNLQNGIKSAINKLELVEKNL
jgi:dTDP-4-dehydrorhamnose reductase